jgi:hypothetical protein
MDLPMIQNVAQQCFHQSFECITRTIQRKREEEPLLNCTKKGLKDFVTSPELTFHKKSESRIITIAWSGGLHEQIEWDVGSLPKWGRARQYRGELIPKASYRADDNQSSLLPPCGSPQTSVPLEKFLLIAFVIGTIAQGNDRRNYGE